MGAGSCAGAAREMTGEPERRELSNIYMERPISIKSTQNSGSLSLNNSLLFYILKCI